jgi:hypothetical protein
VQVLYESVVAYAENLKLYDVAESPGEDYQAFWRFISYDGTTKSGRFLDLLAGCGLQIWTQSKRRDKKDAVGLFDLEAAFTAYCAGKLSEPVEEHYVRASGLPLRPPAEGLLIIPRDKFEDASEFLTGSRQVKIEERDNHNAYYACFRYATTVGSIAKSQFQVKPCVEGDPVCRFENIFHTKKGTARASKGIVFKEGGWIYFLGQIGDDGSIKVVAMDASGNKLPDLKPAILLSKGSSKPLVSRAALQKLKKPLTGKEIRVEQENSDPEFSTEEFSDTIGSLIRNSMDFQLKHQIVFLGEDEKWRKMSQVAMVVKVGELLDGRFKLKLSTGAEVEFNPAEHKHYPFNHVIVAEDP